ncbi:MAG: MotA/TolQ/ExbB proton channel family protein [Lentisphaeria bacterium]|nr:MotA/TolQ/ExbB proton channel family protein [Lentisphaeria bacterium]
MHKRLCERLMAVGFLGPALLPCALSAAEETAVRSIDLKEIFEQGGVIMKAIAALSVLVLFLAFLFAFTMRSGTLYPRKFIQEAEDAAEEGDLEALRSICADSDSAAARIIEAAAELFAGDGRSDYMVVRDAIEDEGTRQAGVLWQRIQYLQDAAVVAPMLGLLGTVLGMMRSFAGLQAGVSFVNKADALATGVAEAMYTTAAGLVVGICTMAIYAFFRGHANRLIGGLENACNRVLRRCAAKRQSQGY